MTTVTVTQTHDYTNDNLGVVDAITFTNSGLIPATAAFTGAQLEGTGSGQNLISLTGSAGVNRIVIAVAVHFDAGFWTITNWSAADRITMNGGTGDDRIGGSSVTDLMYGGAGNDILRSSGSADRMYGGNGDDSFYLGGVDGTGGTDAGMSGTLADGGAGVDLFRADFSTSATAFTFDISADGAGADIGGGIRIDNFEKLFLFLGAADDRVVGGALADYVYTTGGSNDSILGGDGNDTLDVDLAGTSLPTAMVLDGGAGSHDQLSLDLEGSMVAVVIDQTQAGLVAIGNGISIAGCEDLDLTLGSGNDTVIGGGGAGVHQRRGGQRSVVWR